MTFFNLTCCLNALCSFDAHSHKYANLFCLSCVLMRTVMVSTGLMQTILHFWGAYLIPLWHKVSLNNRKTEDLKLTLFRIIGPQPWHVRAIHILKGSTDIYHLENDEVRTSLMSHWHNFRLRFQPLTPIWIWMMGSHPASKPHLMPQSNTSVPLAQLSALRDWILKISSGSILHSQWETYTLNSFSDL